MSRSASDIDLNVPFKNILYVVFTLSALVATAIVTAVLISFIAWLLLRGRHAMLAERLQSKESEIVRLTFELSAVRSELMRLTTAHAQVATQLDAERAAHERLTNEFKALSAEALRNNNESFLKLAQATLEKYQEGAKGELTARQQAVENLVKPLKESLEKVDKKIAEFETSRLGDNKVLSERLKDLGAAQMLLQAEANKLSTALRSTTYAGSWGELQLRRVVEMADMLGYCDFCEQDSSGGLRADLVVRLPGGQRIVVDAKAPLESYRAASDTLDEATRALRLADHAQKVRGHIDALGAKNYWEQFQPAPEFVVLFLPGDHFLTAALQTDRTLMDRALTRRVLLATPTTLIALLKAAAYGWRQEAVSKNAEEIAALGRDLHDRIATFAEHLENVGSGLKSALGHYNKAIGSYEAALLPGARKLSELGAKGAKTIPEPIPIDVTPRALLKRTRPDVAQP